ncbi:hypothetical protein V5F72_24075 [Xanthobacter flavus]|uniref:hypothetical protein n=1 Tax=Xanthobacter flavus TaxID=281 RepID=UPI00372AA0E8
MVKIPDVEDFNSRKDYGAERGITISPRVATIPNAGAPGAALAGVGKAISGVGADFQAIAEKQKAEQEKLDEYKAVMGYQNTLGAIDADLDEKKRTMAPDGSGYEDAARGVVDSRFGAFLGSLPPKLRPRYEAQVAGARRQYEDHSRSAVETARDNFYVGDIAKSVDPALLAIQKDPDNFDKYAGGFADRVAASGLSPARQRAIIDKFNPQFNQARVQGLIDAGRDEEAKTLAKQMEEQAVRSSGGSSTTGTNPTVRWQGATPAVTAATRAVLSKQRSAAVNELNNDPQLKAFVFGVAKGEDDENPGYVLESLLNRAAMTGKSVRELVNSGFYGPVNRGEIKAEPQGTRFYQKAQDALDDAAAGSNHIELRTDQGMANEHRYADANPGVGGKKRFGADWYSHMGPDGVKYAQKTQAEIDAVATSGNHILGKTPTQFVEDAIKNRNLKQDKVSAQERATVKSLMADDDASINATGKPVPELTTDRVAKVFGPEEAAAWEKTREHRQQLYTATSDFQNLPEEEIRARIEKMAPQPGAAGFKEQQEMVDAARKRAEAIFKTRREDPARSVSEVPEVQKAIAAAKANPQAPGVGQALVEARLRAQQKIGIPKEAQEPVTKTEAQFWLKPIHDAVLLEASGAGQKGAVRKAQDDLVQQLRAQYGNYADEVMVSVLSHAARNENERAAVGQVLRALTRGDPVPARAQQRTAAAMEGADAQQAMAGKPVSPPTQAAVPSAGTSQQPQQKAFPRPSAKAIQILTERADDPTTVAQFVQTFGPAAYAALKPKPKGTTTMNPDGSENWTPE